MGAKIGTCCATYGWWPQRWLRTQRTQTQHHTQARIADDRERATRLLEAAQAQVTDAQVKLGELKRLGRDGTAEATRLKTILTHALKRAQFWEKALLQNTELEQSLANHETMHAASQLLNGLQSDLDGLLRTSVSPQRMSEDARDTLRVTQKLTASTERGLEAVARALQTTTDVDEIELSVPTPVQQQPLSTSIAFDRASTSNSVGSAALAAASPLAPKETTAGLFVRAVGQSVLQASARE